MRLHGISAGECQTVTSTGCQRDFGDPSMPCVPVNRSRLSGSTYGLSYRRGPGAAAAVMPPACHIVDRHGDPGTVSESVVQRGPMCPSLNVRQRKTIEPRKSIGSGTAARAIRVASGSDTSTR
jgi:hypothetical protein